MHVFKSTEFKYTYSIDFLFTTYTKRPDSPVKEDSKNPTLLEVLVGQVI